GGCLNPACHRRRTRVRGRNEEGDGTPAGGSTIRSADIRGIQRVGRRTPESPVGNNKGFDECWPRRRASRSPARIARRSTPHLARLRAGLRSDNIRLMVELQIESIETPLLEAAPAASL